MGTYYVINTNSDILYHSGIKGMRWGRRRYQNEDGSLTPAGRERYGRLQGRITKYEDRKSDIQKRLHKEMSTRKYAKATTTMSVKRDMLKAKSDRLKAKNQKTRYKMEMLGKQPGFFKRRNLRKEYRVNKKLAKVEKRVTSATRKVSRLKLRDAKMDRKILRAQKAFNKFDKKYDAKNWLIKASDDVTWNPKYNLYQSEIDAMRKYGVKVTKAKL